MATKSKTPTYRCTECGWSTIKWVGRCGECQAWGTVAEAGQSTGVRTAAAAPGRPAVPIAEVDHWLDLDPDLTAHLFDVSRRIAVAQQQAFSPARVGLIIAGYEVPHTHIHVIPTNDMEDLSFANAAASVERDEIEQAAARIKEALR